MSTTVIATREPRARSSSFTRDRLRLRFDSLAGAWPTVHRSRALADSWLWDRLRCGSSRELVLTLRLWLDRIRGPWSRRSSQGRGFWACAIGGRLDGWRLTFDKVSRATQGRWRVNSSWVRLTRAWHSNECRRRASTARCLEGVAGGTNPLTGARCRWSCLHGETIDAVHMWLCWSARVLLPTRTILGNFWRVPIPACSDYWNNLRANAHLGLRACPAPSTVDRGRPWASLIDPRMIAEACDRPDLASLVAWSAVALLVARCCVELCPPPWAADRGGAGFSMWPA